MNPITVVCMLPFLIVVIHADKHPCKDVTFGECDTNGRKSNVISEKLQQNVQLCNKECNDTKNCTTYRYDNETKECTIMTDDYRKSCNINAGPMDKDVTVCLRQISNQICDSHVEEDCEYNGELLRRFQEGRISDPKACQSLCKKRASECKYWIYHQTEALCIHMRDGRKTCNVLGGPKQPSYDH